MSANKHLGDLDLLTAAEIDDGDLFLVKHLSTGLDYKMTKAQLALAVGGSGQDGTDGTDGADGAPGPPGAGLATRYLWSTSGAIADPGVGYIASNGDASILSASITADGSSDAASFLTALGASTNATKGYLTIVDALDPIGDWAQFSVQSSTDETGYYQVAVTLLAIVGSFTADHQVWVMFSPAGDAGSGSGGSAYVFTDPPSLCVTQGSGDFTASGLVRAEVRSTDNETVKGVTLHAPLSFAGAGGEAGQPIHADVNAMLQALDGLDAGYAFFADPGPVALWSGVIGGIPAAGWIDENAYLRDVAGAYVTDAIQSGDTLAFEFTAIVSND